jgi:hypothetical protein
MGNDRAVHRHHAEAGKNALPPVPRRYNDTEHDGEVNRMKLRFAAALAALILGGGPALAAPVCIDAADPQCAAQTDDPQPNVGDVAPGMMEGVIAAPPAMNAPAMAAPPRAAKPTPLPPAPEPAPPADPGQDDDSEPAQ